MAARDTRMPWAHRHTQHWLPRARQWRRCCGRHGRCGGGLEARRRPIFDVGARVARALLRSRRPPPHPLHPLRRCPPPPPPPRTTSLGCGASAPSSSGAMCSAMRAARADMELATAKELLHAHHSSRGCGRRGCAGRSLMSPRHRSASRVVTRWRRALLVRCRAPPPPAAQARVVAREHDARRPPPRRAPPRHGRRRAVGGEVR